MTYLTGMDATLEYALSFVGTAYKWGGDDPIEGIDCSGYAQEIMQSSGIHPGGGDMSAKDIAVYLRNLPGSKILLGDKFKRGMEDAALGLGAYAFYGKSLGEVSHIVFLVNSWQAIGANGGGSKTVDQKSAARDNAFVKIRPIDYRKDLIAVIMPEYPPYFFL